MHISKEDLLKAVEQKIIDSKQAEQLWNAWQTPRVGESGHASFNFSQIAYYLGAVVILVALTWFLSLSWTAYGGLGVFFISLLYLVVFLFYGAYLWVWEKGNDKTVGGILCTLAACMVPIMTYGFENFLSMWPTDSAYIGLTSVQLNRVLIELGTIIGVLAIYSKIRFPLLMAPLAVALWGLVLDLIVLIMGLDETVVDYFQLSLFAGLVILLIAYLVDLYSNSDLDQAFWLYLIGVMAFWIGLSFYFGDGLPNFVYFVVNLILIFIALVLNRKTFLVFGSMGVLFYLFYLVYDAFEGSIAFPIILSLIGIGVIYVGIVYQRYYRQIQDVTRRYIPSSLKHYLPNKK